MIERTIFRSANSTGEQVVFAGRCRLIALIPELTTTGTVTLRNGAVGGSDIKHLAAIGMTQVGKEFYGPVFPAGLTIQQSVGTDICAVVFEAY